MTPGLGGSGVRLKVSINADGVCDCGRGASLERSLPVKLVRRRPASGDGANFEDGDAGWPRGNMMPSAPKYAP